MNVKRFGTAALALFIFIFFYEWVAHGVVLMKMYKATAHVWRNFMEMQANIPIMMAMQLVLSLWVTFIFTQLFPQGGWKEGLLFGLYLGIFAGLLAAFWYLYLPVPFGLGLAWFAVWTVEFLGGGFILGSLYRK